MREPTNAEIARWFEAGRYSSDFVTNKVSLWCKVLEPLRGKRPKILEIGSMEGRSAVFFLNYLPGSTVTCIDPLSPQHAGAFAHNLSAYEDRLRLMRGNSLPKLIQLRGERASFDLIYIDGSHDRENVFLDSILSWPMLNVGGILMWDDYKGFMKEAPMWQRPTGAIDGFLLAHEGEYETVHAGKQMIIRKTIAGPYGKLKLDTFTVPAARTIPNLIRFLRKRLLKV